MEWLDLSIPSPDSIKIPREVLKCKEVCIAFLPSSHLSDLFRLKDSRINTMQDTTVKEKRVGIAIADEAGIMRRDS